MPLDALEALLEDGRSGLWFLPADTTAKAVQAAAKAKRG